jgi:hypothetical protein
MDVYFYLKLLLLAFIFFLCYWFRGEKDKQKEE